MAVEIKTLLLPNGNFLGNGGLNEDEFDESEKAMISGHQGTFRRNNNQLGPDVIPRAGK